MSENVDNILKLGNLEFESLNDRVLIIEDEFRSGYECLTCMGKQWVHCDSCDGSGKSRINEMARCSKCQGQKRLKCPACQGKGVEEGGLIVPEQSMRRPTTGRIVSVGQFCKEFSQADIGKSVIYPDFCGHVYDLGTSTFDADNHEIMAVCRIIRESDLLARVKGHMELRRIKKSVAHVTE
jgi:co-chaperonin GroES (HSP10)